MHLLWPGTLPDPASAFSQFHQLTDADFAGDAHVGVGARLAPDTATAIGALAESLRARALGARHRYLVDNFCDQARALGKSADVQPARFISLNLGEGRQVAVVPAIGVPSGARYQEIEAAIAQTPAAFEKIWLLYDERGILDVWLEHIDWLNKHLPVSAVRVTAAGRTIQEMSS